MQYYCCSQRGLALFHKPWSHRRRGTFVLDDNRFSSIANLFIWPNELSIHLRLNCLLFNCIHFSYLNKKAVTLYVRAHIYVCMHIVWSEKKNLEFLKITDQK